MRYRTYQRGSGVRGSILGWLFVIVLAVVIVLGVGTYLSSSVIGPYVGASVNEDARDQAAAAPPDATATQEDAALPADGGWDAQDQQLMDDLYTLLAKVNDVDARVSKRLEREAEAQTKRPKRGRQTRIPSFDEVFES